MEILNQFGIVPIDYGVLASQLTAYKSPRQKIVELVKEGDLVITADIPLADRVISKNAHAIDHRGELYSVDNIKQYLAFRNLMEKIRESGEMTRGPKPFNQKDAHQFANQLNKFLAKNIISL